MSYVNSNTQQTSEVTKAAETHSTEELVTMLRQLKLSAMADCLAECIHCQRFQEIGFNDQLYELVVCEKNKRHNSSYERRKKNAALFSGATKETLVSRKEHYHFSQTRIDYLTSCSWREKDVAILIVGKCGCGKTDLGCAIVDFACRRGLKAKCVDFDNLILELVSAKKKNDDRDLFAETINSYCRYDLLFIDDICMEPAISGAALAFKEFLDKFRKPGSGRGLVLASQLKPAKWHERLGGTPESCDAVIDRVLKNYELISLEGRSHRSSKPNNASEIPDELASSKEDQNNG